MVLVREEYMIVRPSGVVYTAWVYRKGHAEKDN